MHNKMPSKRTTERIARVALYFFSALAVVLGLLVWPARVVALGNAHGLAGWLVIITLWTLAVMAWRRGVPRSRVWAAVAWGVVTALGASAQYKLPAGSVITILHVATGLGAIAWGAYLVARMRQEHDDFDHHLVLPIADAANAFLARKRIAVTGVSRHAQTHGANVVFKRLRECGYDVFAINPNAKEVEGVACFPSLRAVPGGVDAVLIATRADRAMGTMQECAELGIKQVWMHRSVGAGSVSQQAAEWGRAHGISVIAGGCPLMFEPVADPAHKTMRSLYTLTGRVPRHV